MDREGLGKRAGKLPGGRGSRLSRRAFFAVPAVAAAGTLGVERWARLVEFEHLEITQKRVPMPHLACAVRVMHIADFHLEEAATLAYLGHAFDLALAQNPDFICISGDFITDRLVDYEGYVGVLSKLASTRPTYAATGNHDGGAWSLERNGYADSRLVRKVLEESGIECLHNRAITREVRGQAVRVIGVADFWAGEARPYQAFAGADREETPSIVIAHNPDYKDDLQRYPWDLMLAGHTHGGQWRLPLVNWAPFVPIRDRRFVEGLHAWNGRQVHVTRGVGAILQSRFNCRPELSVLDLVPKGSEHA
jgi:predicted MPP superfamily phosphohydrolase